MIITVIKGGLGNQMFQYAAGRALALRLGVKSKLDTSWFTGTHEGGTVRHFMLVDAFGLAAVVASQDECDTLQWHEETFPQYVLRRLRRLPKPYARTFIQEPHFSYWAGFDDVTDPAYLYGYWQNERYFNAFAKMIRNDFIFPSLPTEESRHLAWNMQVMPHSVSVHIRRGDYVSNPQTTAIHGLCSSEYYAQSLAYIYKKIGHGLNLFLFSDEPEWVREHFDTQGFSATVVDFSEHISSPWHDMHLMSLCKHHIIANSSFSWWGAWLDARGGVVCAPKQWFAPTAKISGHPAPDHWKLL